MLIEDSHRPKEMIKLAHSIHKCTEKNVQQLAPAKTVATPPAELRQRCPYQRVRRGVKEGVVALKVSG